MPNRCTKCGKIHEDDSKNILSGCDNCGSRFFFYVRQEALEKIEKEIDSLSSEEIAEIEKDIREIMPEKVKEDETVILDLEAVRVLKPGKYLIDVTNLFNQNPIVIRIGSGRYQIDLSTLMKRWKGKVKTK